MSDLLKEIFDAGANGHDAFVAKLNEVDAKLSRGDALSAEAEDGWSEHNLNVALKQRIESGYYPQRHLFLIDVYESAAKIWDDSHIEADEDETPF
jgi:hypothetical protein